MNATPLVKATGYDKVTAGRRKVVFVILSAYALVHLLAGLFEVIRARMLDLDEVWNVFWADFLVFALVPIGFILALPSIRLRALLQNPWEWMLVGAVAVVTVLSTAMGPVPGAGFTILAHTLVAALLVPVVAWLFADAPIKGQIWLCIVLVLAAVLVLPVFAYVEQVYGFRIVSRTVVLPGIGPVRVYGHVATAAVAMVTGLLIQARFDNRGRFALALVLILLWTALAWSGSRGGVLALGVAFTLTALLSTVFRRAIAFWLLPAMIGIALSALIPPSATELGLVQSVGSDVQGLSAGNGDLTTSRAEIWARAIAAIRQAPLLGYGFGQSSATFDWPTITMHHLHNSVIELWYSIGIPAGTIMIFLVAKYWLRACRGLMADPQIAPAFLTVTTVLVFSLVSGTYFHIEGLFPLCAAAGLILARRSTAATDTGNA